MVEGGCGRGMAPEGLGWAPGSTARLGVAGWSGRMGASPSDGVEGLEAVPGGGQVTGPFPAGWHLQDSTSGVGDQAGWGGQEPEAQRLGGGFGKVAVQCEVAQPGGQRGG